MSRFRAVAKDGPVHAVLFAHPLNPGAFDETLLGVFMPHLRLVAGMGAGYDHGECSHSCLIVLWHASFAHISFNFLTSCFFVGASSRCCLSQCAWHHVCKHTNRRVRSYRHNDRPADLPNCARIVSSRSSRTPRRVETRSPIYPGPTRYDYRHHWNGDHRQGS